MNIAIITIASLLLLAVALDFGYKSYRFFKKKKKNEINSSHEFSLDKENQQKLDSLGNEISEIRTTTNGIPMLDLKVENMSKSVEKMPYIQTKIDGIETSTNKISTIKDNINDLKKMADDIQIKANNLSTMTKINDGKLEKHVIELSRLISDLKSKNATILEKSESALKYAEKLPGMKENIDTIKNSTSSINVIKNNVDTFNIMIQSLNKLTAKLSSVMEQKLEDQNKNIGEMSNRINNLAKIFTNDRTRGKVGEYSLNTILSEFLGAEGALWKSQYSVKKTTGNDAILGNVDAVVFSKVNDQEIAIDAKFTLFDYDEIFVDDLGVKDTKKVKIFENKIKEQINSLTKYINVDTKITSVIMYLPSEGLYYLSVSSEAIMKEAAKRKILLAGPTILMAILSSQKEVIRDHGIANNLNQIKVGLRKLGILFNNFQDRSLEVFNSYERYKKLQDESFHKLNTTKSKIIREIGNFDQLYELPTTNKENFDNTSNKISEASQLLGQ